MYVHLKKNLDPENVNWLRSSDVSPRSAATVLTTYGMRRDVQAKIADIRTDLDSFSDCEAEALMLSGYLMTDHEFEGCIKGFPVDTRFRHKWLFLRLAPIAASPKDHAGLDRLLRALDIAKRITWKPFFASHVVKGLTGVVAAGFLYLVVRWCSSAWAEPLPGTWGQAVAYAIVAVALLSVFRLALNKWFKNRNPYIQIVASLLLLPVGWLLLRLYLRFIEPFYTKYGPKYETPEDKPESGGKAAAAGI
jgi:hypothetical protein